MNVDCTLDSFSVPGFSGITPLFGTKKPALQPISSREEHANISMPFALMRPHVVNENSTTTEVEVNSVFDITAAGITLEISEAAYNRCGAHVVNSANGSSYVLVNGTETITLLRGEVLDLDFSGGRWKRKTPKECLRMLAVFDFIADDPVAASTGNINVVAGGLLTVDGVSLSAGNRVFLKDQTDPVQNGYWIAQSGSWNRDPSYAAGNTTAFTNKFISPVQGEQKGMLFFLAEDYYTVGTDVLNFEESKFSLTPLPGRIPLYDRNGSTPFPTPSPSPSGENSHADMVEGMGRDLRDVFGIDSNVPSVYLPLISQEIRRRCNNNGEIDGSGVPDFTGIEIGDYVDGIDLSGVAAPTSGTAPQAWNETYKNNRILVSGFNTYKNMGDTENAKNHIVFTFRNIIAKGRMNTSDANSGGYRTCELRTWMEGAAGDGSGVLAVKLKAQLGGEYLYTIRKYHSTKSGSAWDKYTLFPPSELEVFGVPVYGDEGVYITAITSPSIVARAGAITPVHLPIYQKGYVYRVKRWNGARDYYWELTPTAYSASYFCSVSYGGYAASAGGASGTGGGVSPVFCVA